MLNNVNNLASNVFRNRNSYPQDCDELDDVYHNGINCTLVPTCNSITDDYLNDFSCIQLPQPVYDDDFEIIESPNDFEIIESPSLFPDSNINPASSTAPYVPPNAPRPDSDESVFNFNSDLPEISPDLSEADTDEIVYIPPDAPRLSSDRSVFNFDGPLNEPVRPFLNPNSFNFRESLDSNVSSDLDSDNSQVVIDIGFDFDNSIGSFSDDDNVLSMNAPRGEKIGQQFFPDENIWTKLKSNLYSRWNNLGLVSVNSMLPIREDLDSQKRVRFDSVDYQINNDSKVKLIDCLTNFVVFDYFKKK